MQSGKTSRDPFWGHARHDLVEEGLRFIRKRADDVRRKGPPYGLLNIDVWMRDLG